MSYARAHFWLGITGVGSLVTMAFIALTSGLPEQFLASQASYGTAEFLQLAAVTGLFMLRILPQDFLGGFLLPAKFEKSDQAYASWLRGYATAAFLQAILFLIFGSLVILLSQTYGQIGGIAAISLCSVACFVIRNRLLLNRKSTSESSSAKLVDAISLKRTEIET